MMRLPMLKLVMMVMLRVDAKAALVVSDNVVAAAAAAVASLADSDSY
ncbi:MAG: hypothetical protein QWI73_05925 [Alphaproteobacteria bacterium]|nr:hypothetical protein [Alphaproteobacteria bacterium]